MLERKFLASATLQTVLDYLTIEGFPAEEYKVLSSWPRRDVSTYSFLFEPELALLVGLQVVSSKEEGGIKLFDKILMLGIVAYACLGGSSPVQFTPFRLFSQLLKLLTKQIKSWSFSRRW